MQTNKRPAWWLCYLVYGLMLGLWGLIYDQPLSHAWQLVWGLATLAVGCGLLVWWLYTNRVALAAADRMRQQLPRAQNRLVPLYRSQPEPLAGMQAGLVHSSQDS